MSDYYAQSTDSLPLFDWGATAQQTRSDAYIKAKPKRGQRIEAAEAAIRDTPDGLTRHELADALNIPLQSVCSIALALLDEGKVFEQGARRTPHGSQAAILVHVSFIRGE
jgi:hypothetical protein